MDLHQLFYVSRATTPYDTAAVRSILEQARNNNRQDDVTGCLLFSGRYFAQVLEGRQASVDKALERIRRDKRHVDFRLLAERQMDQRLYGVWSMGYLHDMLLEDYVEALVINERPDPFHVINVMERMRPDSLMGALA